MKNIFTCGMEGVKKHQIRPVLKKKIQIML